jgi:glutaredoxin 3
MLTLYTKDYCPYCVQAKNLLNALGASYQEIDITNNQEILIQIAQKSRMRTVPQIFLDDECLGGYTDIADLHREGKLREKLGL